MSIKVLIVAEAANPEWPSVPLVGWSLASAISRVASAHLVTQVRNRAAILRSGFTEDRDFTVIDSELVAQPLWRVGLLLGGSSGVGWTTNTALSAFAYYFFEALVWKRFGDMIRRGHFHLVHRITPLSPTVPSLLAKKCSRVGIPFVVGPLNGGVPWPPGFEYARRKEREWLSYIRSAYKLLPGYRSMLECAGALIVGSRDTLKQIPRPFHEKCVYIPENAVDLAKFRHDPKPTVQRRIKACFVGRLVPYKAPDIVIEALAPLLRSRLLCLDIIGDGPLKSELKRMVQREALEDHVAFRGWIDHAKLPQVMNESQLFVFPSIREFGGGVVLEAMALGLVPVVVDYGGPGELVTSEVGFKIPIARRSEMIERLRSVVQGICSAPEQTAAMSAAARERVRMLFTWDRKADQVKRVYDWVLHRGRDKPSFFDAGRG